MGEGCCARPWEEARTKAMIANAGPPAFRRQASKSEVERERKMQESGRREPDRGAINPSQNSRDALVLDRQNRQPLSSREYSCAQTPLQRAQTGRGYLTSNPNRES